MAAARKDPRKRETERRRASRGKVAGRPQVGGRRWWLQPDCRQLSSDRCVPVSDDVVLGRGGLISAHELWSAADGRQRRGGRLVDLARLFHGRLANGPCETFQPEVLAFVGVEV